MHRKFASIEHSAKYGYALDTEQWKSGEVDSKFRMFETYGDGLTQHSGDWPVTRDFMADYLNSLAVEMMAKGKGND